MTATVSETTLSTPVDVRFTAAGLPLAVRYDGQVWAVAAEPLHWFTRDSWWETRRTVPVGVGNVVDIEHWRLQVRLGASVSVLRTFVLRRHPLSEQWFLESITDS
ncbi:hypothetical protein [Pseudarthrobacter phenanthrenivorans]|uniref:hypothetical protein n=1 Tax=Pseudarthrobacter phenanthrenivorans TaxID=361575 RepID=UPI001FE249B0|nr:hypothetical protein [Pseudarthrobacter phenanthrenivorans]